MRKIGVLLICMLFIQSHLYAQMDTTIVVLPPEEETYESQNTDEEVDDEVGEEPDIQSDTTLFISSNKLEADTILNWKNAKQFSYMSRIDSLLREKEENKDADQNSRGDARKSRDHSTGSNFTVSPLMGWILWGIAGLVVLFVLYNVFMSKGIFAKSRNRPGVVEIKDENETEEEVIPEGGYASLIRNAEKENNYRLAIRYQFLSLLKRLADKELLHPATGKTNAAYIRELPVELRQDFSALVRIYEYAWYGRIPVAENRYHELTQQFNRFIP